MSHGTQPFYNEVFRKDQDITTGNNETGGAGISLAISLPAEMEG
ncbi:hypothetical protein Q9R46_01805 [Paenibacillus sp. RRE4]|nr:MULTISPECIES: hypothetical protein [Paenibacillus]MDT0121363.1 hypothetical protein [Paenibacillus sp. RRE4]